VKGLAFMTMEAAGSSVRLWDSRAQKRAKPFFRFSKKERVFSTRAIS